MDKTLAKYGIWAPVVLRVIIGIVFAMHGYQKLTMISVANVAEMFGGIGIPAPMVMAWVVTLVELLGGIALIIGLYTRWIAIPLAVIMLVALFSVHLSQGFFISMQTSQVGIEFTLTLFAALVGIALLGAGPASVDQRIGQA